MDRRRPRTGRSPLAGSYHFRLTGMSACLARLPRRSIPLLLGTCLAGSACVPETTAVDRLGPAQLALRPQLPGSLSEASFALPVDRARLLLVRSSGVSILDTLIPFPLDSSQLSVRVKLPLSSARELVSISLELRSNKQLLFTGRREVEMRAGEVVSPPLALTYVGPGADVIALRLTPRDALLALGDTLTMGLEAFSAAGPTRSYYVGWSSSNPALASVNAVGLVRAPTRRGTTVIRALSPTGIRDSTRIWFAPPAARVEPVGGNLQSGTVGRPLPEPISVRVVAADSLGVPGVRVRFRAAGLGAVVDTLVVSDSSGLARTVVTLGFVAGPESYVAQVAGLGSLTFSAVALPEPPRRLLISGGDGQTGVAGTVLPEPFAILVTDTYNNPVPGTPLTWTILEGNGSFVESSAETTLEGKGFARFRLGSQAGLNRVRVSLATGATAEFTAAAQAGGPPGR